VDVYSRFPLLQIDVIKGKAGENRLVITLNGKVGLQLMVDLRTCNTVLPMCQPGQHLLRAFCAHSVGLASAVSKSAC